MTECNGIEKYVKDTLKKNNVEFIPIGKAKCLENSD